ncbi:uncharacterized protein LOC143046047 [Mytilus galloprovincialis]|uniref:uncharacterized protein LOC143046047 n=1 Tax=Mytilus galloprovincialis TaxID=29158 RepID=UPI003F7B58E7
MKELLKRLVDAVCVLPLTAGKQTRNPNTGDDGGTAGLDGTVTGPVLCITALAILCQIFSLSSNGLHSSHNSVLTLMTVFVSLSVASCIAISIYSQARPDVRRNTHDWNISIALEIRFYWLFSLACLTYAIINLCFHIECFYINHQRVNASVSIATDIGFFLFYIFQTGFFTRYLHYRFEHRIGVYYGLLIIVVTNLSIFCREFAILYHDPLSHSHWNSTVTDTCHNMSVSTYVILKKSKPFLHPALFEYSLLTMIFLSKVWPRESCRDDIRRASGGYENVYESIDCGESSRLVQRRPASNETDVILLSLNTTSSNDIDRRTRKFISISLAVIINMPAVVLHILNIINEESMTEFASTIYNIVQQFVILYLNLRCFYMMKRQCELRFREIRKEHYTSRANQYILLLSSFGIMSFYTVVLYARISSLGKTESDADKMKILLDISRMVSTYLQTVFLLQMKHYQRTINIDSVRSIEYLCLFLAVENLCSWAINTFIDSDTVLIHDVPFRFFGQEKWSHLFRFWYPFIIFYRFKCFVVFYSFYHLLK